MIQKIKNIILKSIVWFCVIILVSFLALTTIINIPQIQTKIVRNLSDDISEVLGLEASIGYVDLNWFDVMEVRDVVIKDHYDSTLIVIDKGVINFSITSFMNRAHRVLDKVSVDGGEVILIKHKEEEPVNFTYFIDSIKTNLIKRRGTRNQFEISKASLKNVDVHYDYPETEELQGVFDLNHFDIENLSGDLSDFITIEDTLKFTAINLSGYENNIEMPLNHLSTDFLLCQKSISLSKLNMHAGNSHLTDSIIFTFDTLAALSDFQNSVKMSIRLVDSRVFSDDLGKFSPYFNSVYDLYTISGTYIGNVPDFQVRNLDVRFGNSSNINGNLSFSGLPNFEESFITARFINSNVDLNDVKKYVTDEFYQRVVSLDRLRLNGSFTGFPNDFVADGEFITSLGLVNSDINLKTTDNSYSGNLIMKKFNLGRYLNDPEFGMVSLEGNIVGKGFTLEDADFVLKGNISQIGLNGYDYTNIETDARFASEFFEGNLAIDDPNLKLQAEGTIDLRDDSNQVSLIAALDTAVLDKIYLTKIPVNLSTKIDIDVTGLQLDSIKGKALLKDLNVTTNYNSFDVDNLSVISEIGENSHRKLGLNSEKLDINVEGQFNITTAYEDLTLLVKEYILNIENNSEEIEKYYAEKKPFEEDYNFTYDLSVKDINSFVQLFVPDLSLSKEFKIDGRFDYGETSVLSMYSEIDSINFRNYNFINNTFDIFSSKVSDSTDILAQFQVVSSRQIYGSEASSTDNLFSELIWNENKVDFSVFVEQNKFESYARMLGDILFKKDSTVFSIKPSDIKILEDQWNVTENNSITVSGKEVNFNNLGFYLDDEFVIVDGDISQDPEKHLEIGIEKFELEILNPVVSRVLDGILNAELMLTDYYGERKYEINSRVDSLMVDKFYIGDVLSLSEWIKETQKFNLGFNILRESRNVFDIHGEYSPSDRLVDLDIKMDSLDLGIAETFIYKYFSEMGGTASGEFKVTGDPAEPTLSGTGTVSNGKILVNYLNTRYQFEGDVLFQDNELGFRDLIITDKNQNNAEFNGGFFHEGYGVFTMNFDGTFNNLMAMNTSVSDNDLFYGTAIGSGTMKVEGYPSNLSIKVVAETNRGTRVFIPLSGGSSIDQEDFIQFVPFTKEEPRDTTDLALEGRTLIKGLDFDLDLTVNESAYAEIIFDIKAGDIIRGVGNGDLNIQLNKNGEFTMLGDYVFTEGGYNFTLYNIINKEFDILPDSRISWYGDPYEGLLDIKASYDQLTSIAPLLDTAYRDAPELNRRYPTSVILDLKGPLQSPEIAFDIQINEYPTTVQSGTFIINLETEMNAVYANWSSNEQELQKQVFSLIVLKKFTEDYFNTGGTVGNSVSEFVSNQLSYWISQVDENLEIDINLGQLSQEAYNTFQLRLSYTFMDGRLRVTRDGGFTDDENQSNVALIVGDWSVEYSLNDAGNLRVRLYQKSNYYTSTTLYQDPSVFTGGFSLIYSQSFDEVREVFKKARSSPQKKEQAESKDNPDLKDDKKSKPSTT